MKPSMILACTLVALASTCALAGEPSPAPAATSDTVDSNGYSSLAQVNTWVTQAKPEYRPLLNVFVYSCGHRDWANCHASRWQLRNTLPKRAVANDIEGGSNWVFEDRYASRVWMAVHDIMATQKYADDFSGLLDGNIEATGVGFYDKNVQNAAIQHFDGAVGLGKFQQVHARSPYGEWLKYVAFTYASKQNWKVVTAVADILRPREPALANDIRRILIEPNHQ